MDEIEAIDIAERLDFVRARALRSSQPAIDVVEGGRNVDGDAIVPVRTVDGDLRVHHFKTVCSAARAALKPHMPWTPPPGGVDAEHRNRLGFGVR